MVELVLDPWFVWHTLSLPAPWQLIKGKTKPLLNLCLIHASSTADTFSRNLTRCHIFIWFLQLWGLCRPQWKLDLYLGDPGETNIPRSLNKWGNGDGMHYKWIKIAIKTMVWRQRVQLFGKWPYSISEDWYSFCAHGCVPAFSKLTLPMGPLFLFSCFPAQSLGFVQDSWALTKSHAWPQTIWTTHSPLPVAMAFARPLMGVWAGFSQEM